MIVLNMFGGPGSGKSTLAAEIFVDMKKLHLNTELVTEYAKDKVWEESFAMMENQVYLFGKQQHRLWRVSKKCDVVVTDSPLLLSLYYGRGKCLPTFFTLVLEEFNKYDNINIFLKRAQEYSLVGRNQTEQEAIEVDNQLLDILDSNGIKYVEFEVNEEGVKSMKDYLRRIGAYEKYKESYPF